MKKKAPDVTPASQLGFDTIPEGVVEEVEASKLSTEVLITELWERRVTIKDIFGQFYALEEMANQPFLTVEDVELAGLVSLPDEPIERQPF